MKEAMLQTGTIRKNDSSASSNENNKRLLRVNNNKNKRKNDDDTSHSYYSTAVTTASSGAEGVQKKSSKKSLETMDMDTFMTSGLDNLSGSESDVEAPQSKKTKVTRSKKADKKPDGSRLKKQKVPKEKKEMGNQYYSSIDEPQEKKLAEKPAVTGKRTPDKVAGGQVKEHKAVISGLKDKDPEFYEFLQSQDKQLLNFDESSDEEECNDSFGRVVEQDETKLSSEDDNDESNADESNDAESDKDESDEDESDEDENDEDESNEGRGKEKSNDEQSKIVYVTQKMVDSWSSQLKKKPNVQVVEKLTRAFQAAVSEASGEEITDSVVRYKVKGSSLFNGVVRACLRELPIAFTQILNLDSKGKNLPSSKKLWQQLKMSFRHYFPSLVKLLANLGESEVINVVLKHITQLIAYFSCMPKCTRILLKKLISIWSTGEETSRVLAFISIIKLIRLQPDVLLEKTLKAMYMAYVRNCKFTSPTLLPMINFMQHSLVELFALDMGLGYQYTFVYVRQLAIHLRNAMTSKKKDVYQVVYNWQYIHSCGLFARIVSTLYNDENIKQLVYPLVQTIMGVMRLIPSAKFYPLRFRCVRMLNLIASKTHLFIPVLPQLLEVFEITDFQKKASRKNMKRVDFSCILRLSHVQTEDRAFKDAVMDQLYELFMDNLNIYSHTIGFPELVIPVLSQMKAFVKTCKVANFTKQVKQIIDKIEATNKVIEKRRKMTSIDLTDTTAVDAWEASSLAEETPLNTYYKQYRALRDKEIQFDISGKEQMEHVDKTPIINIGQKKNSRVERAEFSDLFTADKGESSEDEERFLLKEERTKSKKPADRSDEEEDDDDVNSLNSEEYDMLNKSASEDEESEVEADDDVANDEEISDEDERDDVVEDLELSDLD